MPIRHPGDETLVDPTLTEPNMKKNFPVTSQEIEVPEGISLVSKTDLKGILTYANNAFVEISGYEQEELLGKSHNIVRHPDMPEAVFKDMWATLRSGKPWQGLIKNRCKNGDFYWIEACVVPIRRNEQTIGYMSVRQRTKPEAVAAVQKLYERVAAQGMPRILKMPSWVGIRFGMRAGTVFVALMMLAGGALGIGGLKLADAAFTRMYQEQFEPVTAVGQIEAQLNALRASMLESQLSRDNQIPTGRATSYVEQLQGHYDEIDEISDKLDGAALAASASNAPLTQALQRYIEEGRKIVHQASVGDAATASLSPATFNQLLDLERKASLTAQALRQSLSNAAQQEFAQTLERNASIRQFAVVGIALGLLIVAVVGRLFISGIVNPLNASIRQLNRIAEGDLQGKIELSGTGETAQLNHASAVMQLHLKVMLDEIALAARSIHRHCKKLNAALYEVTEHSEAQHDQVYSAIRALDAATAETRDLSERAERLLNMAQAPDETLSHEIRDLATATRLTAFGAEEVAASMHQVASLIVENRGEAQLAWQASEELMHTARELNNLVDFFEPEKQEA